MNQNVQVSKEFLAGVWFLLDTLKDYELDNITTITCKILQAEVDQKYQALERREAFSKYKSATPGSLERETFRKAYLDIVEMHANWRSPNELSPSQP
jgi:hypothetical protein